jgi:hypothetical protein
VRADLPKDSQEIDKLLPIILKRDNVARYEDGKLLIGDRRKYPFDITPPHPVSGIITRHGTLSPFDLPARAQV